MLYNSVYNKGNVLVVRCDGNDGFKTSVRTKSNGSVTVKGDDYYDMIGKVESIINGHITIPNSCDYNSYMFSSDAKAKARKYRSKVLVNVRAKRG